jgi:transposase
MAKDPSVNLAISADLTMINAFNRLINPLEDKIERIACQHDPNNPYLLKTIFGVGQILALTILYEVHDIKRFKTVQRFCSYARLIRPEKESDGKWAGKSNKKIGNAHLKWAIRTAAMISLRESGPAKKFVDRLSRKYNKGKALGIYTPPLQKSEAFSLCVSKGLYALCPFFRVSA